MAGVKARRRHERRRARKAQHEAWKSEQPARSLDRRPPVVITSVLRVEQTPEQQQTSQAVLARSRTAGRVATKGDASAEVG